MKLVQGVFLLTLVFVYQPVVAQNNETNKREGQPLDRPGEPDDIAGCVLYLVFDADYVTGQIIAVDGGRSIGW